VRDVISRAKFITPNLGELPTALKARCADVNKVLMAEALNICKLLAEAMGPKCRQHSRVFIPTIFGAFGDSKVSLNSTARPTSLE
jgi:cytoskeleton-associated protein 5